MSQLALTIAYLGTAYAGWQVQSNAPTVQAVMCRACDQLFGCKCSVTGCSRTDSGVHARAFLCTVGFGGEHNDIPCDRVPQALNALLPPDVSVLECEPCDDSFHPRYGIRGKEYAYLIHNSAVRDPFLCDRAYQFPAPLDAAAMDDAAREFVGTHDFAAFMAAGSKITDTRRTVTATAVKREGDLVTFTVSANGFLYNMVRIMAGTLVEVGRGKMSRDGLRRVIESADRSAAGATLPACGLYLQRILK